MTVKPLARLGQMAVNMLFPARCAVCGRQSEWICPGCYASLPKALAPRCVVCWEPSQPSLACARCRQHPPGYQALRSPFRYHGPVRLIIHAFKYKDTSALALPMARALASCLQAGFGEDVAGIVPVPLFPSRKRRRGYNQAALLAKELARICDLPLLERALGRRRNTLSQARLTGDAVLDARRANVSGAFVARSAFLPPGCNVLLVDDVITSGATMEACAQALREAGVGKVFGLAFARED